MTAKTGRMTLIPETRRFSTLLAALVFAIFVAPLIATKHTANFWFQASVWTVLLAGLYAASARRALAIVAGLLMLPTLYAWIGPDLFSQAFDNQLRLLSTAACFLFTAVVVGVSLVHHERVSRETILGGVNVYLLLGFAFMLLVASVEIARPGSFTVGGEPLLVHVEDGYGGRAFATLLYFSFTTLTTLGFGDIVPHGNGARLLTSFEALVGQLYIAIFIGRMVGLQAGEWAATRRQAAEPANEESGR